MNETLAQGLGIDSSRVRLITFGTGCGLAAVAGALITPLTSVDPNMGLAWLIGAFMLVMVSGGSLLTLGLSCSCSADCRFWPAPLSVRSSAA